MSLPARFRTTSASELTGVVGGRSAKSGPSSRWIMLGSGAVVREFFLPAFQLLNTLDRLVVVDLTVPGDLRQMYPQVRFVEADFRACLDFLGEQPADAAIVALPNALHEEAVIHLLRAGVNVLCEKPLALNEASCFRMRQAAVTARRLLAVNMVRRWIPAIRAVRQLVAGGGIGHLEAVSVEHGGPFQWPAQSLATFLPENGGVFADMGIHYLDMAESFVGQLELRSYEDDCHGGVEAEATAELASAAGAKVRIDLSRLRTLANTITFVGSSGKIVLNVDSLSTFNLYQPADQDGVEVRPLRPFGSSSLPLSFQACFAKQLESFENRISVGDISTQDVDSARRSAQVIEDAYRLRVSRSAGRWSAAIASGAPPCLVTGATGFIGAHLVERLAKGGSDVTCLVRRPQNCTSIARFPINLVTANLLDADSFRQSMRGRRYVFHLAYGRDGPDAGEITLRGTENVVNAAIEAQCEAVVVLSTINVLGWPDAEVDESAAYRPTGGAYGRTKASMERWCLKRSRDSGNTRIVVLLPSCVYGPGGPTFTELPARLAAVNGFAWISEGRGLANYVFVGNLVDAMVQAACSPVAHGQRFIINDGWTTWRQFLDAIVSPWLDKIPSCEPGELSKKKVRSRRGALKRAFLAAVANHDVRREIKQTMLGSIASRIMAESGLASRLARTEQGSGRTPPFEPPPEWLESLFGAHGTRFSSAKARSLLAWMPRVTLEEGQCLSVEYLKRVGLHPRTPGIETESAVAPPEFSVVNI